MMIIIGIGNIIIFYDITLSYNTRFVTLAMIWIAACVYVAGHMCPRVIK